MAADGAPATEYMVVAIDGPAGAGKSTVARAVAQALGYVLVDTGAIYRTLALVALRRDISLDDEAAVARLAASLEVEFADEADGSTRVLGNGEDVTDAIRAEEVSRAAGQVAVHPLVRAALMAMQRALAGRSNAVLEGRDIGTVICPAAPVKIFLAASLEERARRRHEELLTRGGRSTLAEVRADLEQRDARDQGRAVAPLQAAPDAMHLDCTTMSADEVVAAIVARVRAVASSRPHGPELACAARLVWAAAREQANLPPSPSQDEPTRAHEAAVIDNFFALGLAARFSAQPNLVDTLKGTYLFVVEGPHSPSHVLLDCRQPPVRVAPVAAGTLADCTLGIGVTPLVAMIEGKLHPQLAFMKGVLKVQGDLAMAMRLGALFA